MALVDANGLPISLSLHPANRHEVALAFDLIQDCWTSELPERVIGDKAYDSDGLDEEMADCGVQMIAAHRKNRTKPKTQDGRCLRRAKRRWKVERFFVVASKLPALGGALRAQAGQLQRLCSAGSNHHARQIPILR
jgi:IS5 family transposase